MKPDPRSVNAAKAVVEEWARDMFGSDPTGRQRKYCTALALRLIEVFEAIRVGSENAGVLRAAAESAAERDRVGTRAGGHCPTRGRSERSRSLVETGNGLLPVEPAGAPGRHSAGDREAGGGSACAEGPLDPAGRR